MAVKINKVVWVIGSTLGASWLKQDGTFTTDKTQARRFESYSDALRVQRGLRTPTQLMDYPA